ncbi:MAG: photosynthetic reaction center cytochrome PufC [Myxococcota bacterium]
MIPGLKKIIAATGAAVLAILTIAAYEPTQTREIGAAGVGMQTTLSESRLEERYEYNQAPPSLPPARPGGALAAEAYQNVHVLGHLTTAQFTRMMTAITLWVAPEQGCAYCHNTNNLASDEVYAKRVARRMIQMTQHINENWSSQHVHNVGVTCYTCHRGNNVPQYTWYEAERGPNGMVGAREYQNVANHQTGFSSLPANIFETFLDGDPAPIRVQSTQPLPGDNRSSIKQAEWTYGLMMHFSQSLGVNCTYCHNSRSWASWEQSPAVRGNAWYGIRMVRDINQNYIHSVEGHLPEHRLGPMGDVPKVNCATCHQGAHQPLLGARMLEDYPSLARAYEQPVIEEEPEPAPPVEAGTAVEGEGAEGETAEGETTAEAANPAAPAAPAPAAPAPARAAPAPAPAAPAAPEAAPTE